MIEEAVRAAETLGDPQRLDSFDLVRARLLHAEGRSDEALRVAAGAVRSLITSRSEGPRYGATTNLAVIVATGHPEAAARLNGIAQATMRTMGSIMTFDELARQRQRAAPAVAMLGVESYERTLAEAPSWRREEATEWVLRLADELGTGPSWRPADLHRTCTGPPLLLQRDAPSVRHMISVRALSKQYGGVRAVDDLTFDAGPGKVTGFLGPDGAGKSTTKRVVMGLDRPDAGAATANGQLYPDLAEPRARSALLDAEGMHAGRTGRSHLAGGLRLLHTDANR